MAAQNELLFKTVDMLADVGLASPMSPSLLLSLSASMNVGGLPPAHSPFFSSQSSFSLPLFLSSLLSLRHSLVSCLLEEEERGGGGY